ncbi:MAG TPA: hypothetical protein DEP84_34705 [Chloroflexi bacterium]|nr:hypothetical protein [Chloroflexota bacterium]
MPERTPAVLSTQTLSPAEVRTVVEFAPSADTYIASNRPGSNFGSATGLFLGYNLVDSNYGAERTLLRFDALGTLPKGVIINSARLRLYLGNSNPPNDAPMGTVLRRLASSWTEGSVTWNTQPTWGGIRASTDVGSSLGWYEWDITDLVDDWIQGDQPNYGLEIIGDERVQQRERVFYARETSTALYPRLVVDYTADTLPPIVTVNPLPAYSPATFTVSWSGHDQGPAGIAYYDVQYRVDAGSWVSWLNQVTFTSAQFTGQNGRVYQFRARGVDTAGNVEAFGDAEAQTTVDTIAPSVHVSPLPPVTNAPSFTVRWSGEDNPGGSGIQFYDVQYRIDGGPWVLWQRTTATSATFVPPASGRYEFEARGVDNASNYELFTFQPEARILVDRIAPTVHMNPLPAVTKTASFPVSWSGGDNPGGSGIQFYDVQYRIDGGEWVFWQRTTATSVTFTTSADGLYEFEARGVDNAGNYELFTFQSEAQTLVDVRAPFLQPRIWVPVAMKNARR